jgi:hypothetical protein
MLFSGTGISREENAMKPSRSFEDFDEDPQNGAPADYESTESAPLSRSAAEEILRTRAGRESWESAVENGDRSGNEVENGPDVDPDDPNLSATFTEAGIEERADDLGLSEAGSEGFLDDPRATSED